MDKVRSSNVGVRAPQLTRRAALKMAFHDRKTRKRVAVEKIRVVEEILRRWDPIGVQPGVASPADEYDGYAPHIVSMVEARCTVEALAAHLEHLAVFVMGVGSNGPANHEFASQIVNRLKPQGN